MSLHLQPMERKKVRDSTWDGRDGRDDEDDGRKGVQFGEDGDRGDGKRIGTEQEEKKVAVGGSSVVGMGDEPSLGKRRRSRRRWVKYVNA